nr:hypothetical protein [Tanacetum cinerariifolium]
LRDEALAENEDFINKLDENIQNIIKEQVKVQVFKILPKIEKTVNEQLEDEVLTRSSNSSKTSYAVDTDISKMELKKILIKNMESNKHRDDANKDEEPSAGSDRGPREEEKKKSQSPQVLQRKRHPRPLKLLNILNGFRNKRNLQLPIVLGTRLCQLLTEAFNLG